MVENNLTPDRTSNVSSILVRGNASLSVIIFIVNTEVWSFTFFCAKMIGDDHRLSEGSMMSWLDIIGSD